VDAGLLEVFHDCADEHPLAVAHCVHVQLDGVSQVLVD